MKQIFGRRMRARRSELGITLQELAKRLQASRSYLNRIELGHKNLTLDMAKKIADVLNVPLAKLLEEE